MRVAVLMDSSPESAYHRATLAAIGHAADALGVPVEVCVHATDTVGLDEQLGGVDGVVIGPGSPYRDEASVWSAVRRSREDGVPLVAT